MGIVVMHPHQLTEVGLHWLFEYHHMVLKYTQQDSYGRWYLVLQQLGSIHTHFVRSISNSSINHIHIDLINALIFCIGCVMTKLHHIWHHISYGVKYITFLSIIRCRIHHPFVSNHPLHKKSEIEWDCSNMINQRFQGWMGKRSMNSPILHCYLIMEYLQTYCGAIEQLLHCGPKSVYFTSFLVASNKLWVNSIQLWDKTWFHFWYIAYFRQVTIKTFFAGIPYI